MEVADFLKECNSIVVPIKALSYPNRNAPIEVTMARKYTCIVITLPAIPKPEPPDCLLSKFRVVEAGG